MFHRTPSRGDRGRRAAVDLFRGVFRVRRDSSYFSFFRFIYFELTPPTASSRPPCLMYLSISNLFERSEFLIDTSQKKSLRACARAVCSSNLGFSVENTNLGFSVGSVSYTHLTLPTKA